MGKLPKLTGSRKLLQYRVDELQSLGLPKTFTKDGKRWRVTMATNSSVFANQQLRSFVTKPVWLVAVMFHKASKIWLVGIRLNPIYK